MKSRDWVEDLFQPLVVGAMMGCIAFSLVDLAHLFFPGWNGTYVIVACVLTAVEANYSYHVMRDLNLRGADAVRFRVSELALLFVLLRIGRFVGLSWTEVWATVRTWPREPWRILDLEIGYAFILILLSWTASTRTTHDLERIGEPPVRDKYYIFPVDALRGRFFWGGAMLLWTAGITRIGIAALLNLSRPSVPGVVLNVLLYFALGLAMLGQLQYARLSERWRKEGIDVPKELGPGWVRYTLAFLGVAGLIAFLLPTGYTLPLLDVVSVIVGAIFYVFNLVFQLIILLFFLMLAPLAKLLGADLEGRALDPGPGPELPPLQTDASAPGWLEIGKSAVFWILALGVVVYVVRSYLQLRPELAEAVMTLKPLRAIRRLLLTIWHQLSRIASATRARLSRPPRLGRRGGRGVEEPSDQTPFHLFRLRGLSRRHRTLYYYLSILRRAARQGYPRRRSQTPYEYDAQLGPKVPDAEEEMDRLTDAFVETRYSTHPVDRERERRVRADWKRIRAALRSLRERSDREAGSEDVARPAA